MRHFVDFIVASDSARSARTKKIENLSAGPFNPVERLPQPLHVIFEKDFQNCNTSWIRFGNVCFLLTGCFFAWREWRTRCIGLAQAAKQEASLHRQGGWHSRRPSSWQMVISWLVRQWACSLAFLHRLNVDTCDMIGHIVKLVPSLCGVRALRRNCILQITSNNHNPRRSVPTYCSHLANSIATVHCCTWCCTMSENLLESLQINYMSLSLSFPVLRLHMLNSKLGI